MIEFADIGSFGPAEQKRITLSLTESQRSIKSSYLFRVVPPAFGTLRVPKLAATGTCLGRAGLSIRKRADLQSFTTKYERETRASVARTPRTGQNGGSAVLRYLMRATPLVGSLQEEARGLGPRDCGRIN